MSVKDRLLQEVKDLEDELLEEKTRTQQLTNRLIEQTQKLKKGTYNASQSNK